MARNKPSPPTAIQQLGAPGPLALLHLQATRAYGRSGTDAWASIDGDIAEIRSLTIPTGSVSVIGSLLSSCIIPPGRTAPHARGFRYWHQGSRNRSLQWLCRGRSVTFCFSRHSTWLDSRNVPAGSDFRQALQASQAGLSIASLICERASRPSEKRGGVTHRTSHAAQADACSASLRQVQA